MVIFFLHFFFSFQKTILKKKLPQTPDYVKESYDFPILKPTSSSSSSSSPSPSRSSSSSIVIHHHTHFQEEEKTSDNSSSSSSSRRVNIKFPFIASGEEAGTIRSSKHTNAYYYQSIWWKFLYIIFYRMCIL